MSGGTFDYKEYNIESIANEIREIYLKHKCKEWIKWMRSKEFYADFKPYPKKSWPSTEKHTRRSRWPIFTPKESTI